MSIFAKMFAWLSSLWNYLFRRNVIDKPPKSRENSKDCIISTDEVGDGGETANGSFVDIPLNNTIILVDQPAEGPAWDLGSNLGIGNSLSHSAELYSSKKEIMPELHTCSELTLGSAHETVYSSSYAGDCEIIVPIDPNEEDNLLSSNSCLFKIEEGVGAEDGLETISGTNQFECAPVLLSNPPDVGPTSAEIGDTLASSKSAVDDPVKDVGYNFMLKRDDVIVSKTDDENTLSTPTESQSAPQVSSSNDALLPDVPKPLGIFVDGIGGEVGFGVDESSSTIIDRMLTQCDNVFSVLSSSSTAVDEHLLEESLITDSFVEDTVPDTDPGEEVSQGEFVWDTKEDNPLDLKNCAVYTEYKTDTSTIYKEASELQHESFKSDAKKTISIEPDKNPPSEPIESIISNSNDFCAEAEQSIALDKLDFPSKQCDTTATNIVNSSDPAGEEALAILSDAEFIQKNVIDGIILQKINFDIVRKEERVHPVDSLISPRLTQNEDVNIVAECSSRTSINLPLQDIANIEELVDSDGYSNAERHSNVLNREIVEAAIEPIINDEDIKGTVGDAQILDESFNNPEILKNELSFDGQVESKSNNLEDSLDIKGTVGDDQILDESFNNREILKNELSFDGQVESKSNSLEDSLAPTEYLRCTVSEQERICEAKKEDLDFTSLTAFDSATGGSTYDPGAEIGSSLPVMESYNEYSTNYSMKSDSLVNFLQGPDSSDSREDSGEKESCQPSESKRETCSIDIPEEILRFEEENELGSQAPGIPYYQFDQCPDVLRSIASVSEQDSDGISLGYRTEPDTPIEKVSLVLEETEPFPHDEKNLWKTPGSNSKLPKTDPYFATCSESMYFSGHHDYFGNVIWPPSPVPTYENFSLDSTEDQHPSLEEHHEHIDSLELYPFDKEDTNSPTSIVHHCNGEENVYQCVEPPDRINWPSPDEANVEPESRTNELHGQVPNNSFAEVGTMYFVPNSSATPYQSLHPILNQINFQVMSGLVREAEALRQDFSLSGDPERSTGWVETAAPVTQVAIPVNLTPPTFSGNLIPPDQFSAIQGVGFPAENGCSQNYFSVVDPFGATVFSTPNPQPLLYNSVFSLPIPLPPLVLPVPPLHVQQNQLNNADEDQERFQIASWRPNLDPDTDPFKVSLPAVDMDSADFSNLHEPGFFDDVEDDFSFLPRSTLSKNDSLQTLRSKCDSFSGSLLGESLKTVMSSLNQEAIRPPMSNERRKYSEPSLITNLKSLSHDSLPTVPADDSFSGGGDDNYSAKVRFLNELNLALNESLVDDEFDNVRALSRLGEVLGETVMATKPENASVSMDCVRSSDSKDFGSNGKDIALKTISSFTQSDYGRSHQVVESIVEVILDGIQSARESSSQFSLGAAGKTVDGSYTLDNTVQAMNNDEIIQQQMMVFVRHDFDEFHTWESTNEKPSLAEDLAQDILRDTSSFNSSTEGRSGSVICPEPTAIISCENMQKIVGCIEDEFLETVKPALVSEAQAKRGRRRRKKTSIQLFEEENMILEEPEMNPISGSASSAGLPPNAGLEATISNLESSSEKVVPVVESSAQVKNSSPDIAGESSRGKKRNRRRKKKTN